MLENKLVKAVKNSNDTTIYISISQPNLSESLIFSSKKLRLDFYSSRYFLYLAIEILRIFTFKDRLEICSYPYNIKKHHFCEEQLSLQTV